MRYAGPSKPWKRSSPSSSQALENEVRTGSPWIAKRLQDEDHKASRNNWRKNIMRVQDLWAKSAERYKATTHNHHSLSVAPNQLEQDFEAAASDQKWVSNIVCLDGQRLILPGRRLGPIFAQGGRLGQPRKAAGAPGLFASPQSPSSGRRKQPRSTPL